MQFQTHQAKTGGGSKAKLTIAMHQVRNIEKLVSSLPAFYSFNHSKDIKELLILLNKCHEYLDILFKI